MNFKFYEGRELDCGIHNKQMVGLLQQTHEQYNKMMQATLDKTRKLAMNLPAFNDFKEQISEIRTLEDLTESRFYIDSGEILPLELNETTWKDMLGDKEVVASAMTSGSSGNPKIMPYTLRGIEEYSLGAAPFLSQPFSKQDGKPLVLALTANNQFVTYSAIPKCIQYNGMDVLHAPLSAVLRNPETAQELSDILNKEETKISGIVTVAPMIFALFDTLEQTQNGPRAVERLVENCTFGGYGGVEIHPKIEAFLHDKFGKVINLLASTEYLVVCGSDGQSAAQKMNMALHYCIPSIIPLDELEKESEDYVPKSQLLTEVDIGSTGELVLTLPLDMPWINLRTGDFVTRVENEGIFTSPAIEFYSKASKILNISGAKIYPAELEAAMNCLPKIKDYIMMEIRGSEVSSNVDSLEIYVEGDESFENVANSIKDKVVELEFIIQHNMANVNIYRVEDGTLQKQRIAKSMQLNHAPGPLKHTIVKGKQYDSIPFIESERLAKQKI